MSQGRDASLDALLGLLDFSRRLSRPEDLGEVMRQVIEATCRLLEADRASVFLHDPTTRTLYTVAGSGEVNFRLPQTAGIVGSCFTTRRSINIPDAWADPRFHRGFDEQSGYRTHTLLAVPLLGLNDTVVGVLEALNLRGGPADEATLRLAQLVGDHAGAALQRAQLLTARMAQMKMERDLNTARVIQRSLLPRELAAPRGYDLAAHTEPADQTGGDIYDAQLLPTTNGSAAQGNLVFMLADASGHGIAAALAVTQLQAMLRLGLNLTADLGRLLELFDQRLCSDLPEGRFITAFLASLDAARHELSYHSAGQGPLLLLRGEGRCESLPSTAAPLAMFYGVPADEAVSRRLEVGDVLVIASDGFFEQPGPGGAAFGEAGVLDSITSRRGASAGELVTGLFEDVRRFAAGRSQLDDLTAIVLLRRA